jgi:hypothetical protein
MNFRSTRLLVTAGLLCAPLAAVIAQPKLYRYVDENGVVHYADHIPPEYAKTDRVILNTHGVAVGFEEGEITAEERAEMQRLEAEAAEAERVRADRVRRDRMLLETYLSVADIEDLRDRRLELVGAQIKVTELYLTNLRKRLLGLQAEANRFKPYNAEPNAPQIPEYLALDLSRTLASINLYEQTLSRTRSEQEQVRAAFELDIERFRELKGG